MKKHYEAVIFDLDGTLIDSMWVWSKIDEVYLSKFQLTVPKDMDEELEGMSFTETALYFKERFQLADSVEQIKSDWNQIAWDFYLHEIQLKESVKTFLQLLKSKDIPMGIATSNSRELVMAVLERFELTDYFSSIRISCEVEKGKPHPFVYLKVAEDLGINPNQCLVFEDIPNGILAGKNAGMDVWAVNDRQPTATIERAKELADKFIFSYQEAIDYFHK